MIIHFVLNMDTIREFNRKIISISYIGIKITDEKIYILDADLTSSQSLYGFFRKSLGPQLKIMRLE